MPVAVVRTWQVGEQYCDLNPNWTAPAFQFSIGVAERTGQRSPSAQAVPEDLERRANASNKGIALFAGASLVAGAAIAPAISASATSAPSVYASPKSDREILGLDPWSETRMVGRVCFEGRVGYCARDPPCCSTTGVVRAMGDGSSRRVKRLAILFRSLTRRRLSQAARPRLDGRTRLMVGSSLL